MGETLKRAEIKARLIAAKVYIPVDTVTADLEAMLKAANAKPKPANRNKS